MTFKHYFLPYLLAGALHCSAAVELAPIFSDNMVLQRDMSVPVWGKADPGEVVTVEFAGQKQSTTANNNGAWRIKFSPLSANSENRVLSVCGKENSINVKNVLVGEVWLCSGQSNMEQPLWGSNPRFRDRNGDKTAAKANDPLLRFARMVPYGWSTRPRTDFPISWQAVRPDNISVFSAAGYYFGRDLRAALGIPVGLISAHWGGTRIEPWTPPEGFNSVPQLRDIARQVNAKLPHTAEAKELTDKVKAEYTAWLAAVEKARQSGAEIPVPPQFPAELKPAGNHQQPTVLYNRMVYPFVPFAMRGAIWYQGCSNVSDGMLYRWKMEALFNGWKNVFENPDLKFYFVQLSPYNYGGLRNRPDVLPKLWEAQETFATAHGPEVGMAVINDVGDVNDIHPADKETVGKRLALLARKHTYGEKSLKADAPRLTGSRQEAGAFHLNFDHVESWKTVDNGPVRHFEVAGIDGLFYPATATINGKSVIVKSDKVAAPTMLRYMWHQTAEASLLNEAGLPLGAFRIGKEPDLQQLQNYLDKKALMIFRYDLRAGVGDPAKSQYQFNIGDKISQKFHRITYLVIATRLDGVQEWVCVSLDPFTSDATKLGIPTAASGADFQTTVNNLVIHSNVPGLKTGNFPMGNIEFWPMNYNRNNATNVSGGRNDKYDIGDEKAAEYGAGYGSMQIHNTANKETIFAYNNFSAGPNADFGIGNNPNASQHPDWTFSGNLKNYAAATLFVYITQ